MAGKKTLQASAEAQAAVEENKALGLGERQLPTLRSLGAARVILDRWFEETEGEETPELKELWEQLEGDTRQKVVNWGHYLRNREEAELLMKAEEDFYRREANRLQERRLVHEKGTERSADALLFQMTEQGISEVIDPLITVKLQRNPPSVIGDVPPEVLADWYVRDDIYLSFVKYTPEQFALNKSALKDAAKNMLIERLPEGVEIVAKQRVVVK